MPFLIFTDMTHVAVSDQQEAKLTALIRAKKLPPEFALNGITISRDDILGFSETTSSEKKPVEISQGPSKQRFSSWDEFRDHVKRQSWYQNQKGSQGPSESPRQPEQSPAGDQRELLVEVPEKDPKQT